LAFCLLLASGPKPIAENLSGGLDDRVENDQKGWEKDEAVQIAKGHTKHHCFDEHFGHIEAHKEEGANTQGGGQGSLKGRKGHGGEAIDL
jgi:hypothetical protein